jgi:hypothetical protein
VDVGDVKKTIYYGYVIIKWQVTQNQPFGELIQQNNNPGNNYQLYVFVFQHIFLKGSEVLGSAFRVYRFQSCLFWPLVAAHGFLAATEGCLTPSGF